MLQQMCGEAGFELHITFTEYAGHASIVTRKAIDQGAGCIIAVGGDGTVNEIARAMLHTDAVLGIIPKGSGNGLARELHIPMDSRKALEVIAKGHQTVIDCCQANGRVFFCTCGVGFDATVSQKFAGEKRRGSLTYIKNTIEEYLSYQPEIYDLVVDGKQIQEKAFLVVAKSLLTRLKSFFTPVKTVLVRQDIVGVRRFACHSVVYNNLQEPASPRGDRAPQFLRHGGRISRPRHGW